MEELTYHRPRSLSEALALWADTPGARLIAGGTDVMVRMREGSVRPQALVSLRSVRELATIDVGETIRIGALVTIAELLEHAALCAALPELAQAARVLGSPAIRSAATVGGNLCNASPCADTAPPLLVREAVCEIASQKGARELPLEALFEGPRQSALRQGEVLVALRVPKPAPGARAAFLKKGRVQMDIAIASVAAQVEMESGACRSARVAAGSVGPTPLRLRAVEQVLEGRALSDAVIAEARAAASAEVRPITDVRATADYRRHLSGVLVERALLGLREGRSS